MGSLPGTLPVNIHLAQLSHTEVSGGEEGLPGRLKIPEVE